MGLEVVELLIELEECFQTRIPDSETEKIFTLGELQQFFINRIQQQEFHTCLSASIFYSIRQLLQTNYHIPRKDIRPTSILEDIIPPELRHNFWQTLKQQLVIDLPNLKKSSLLNWKRNQFPKNLVTIKDLVGECEQACSISNKFSLDNEQPVWNTICRIVAKWADVQPEELTPETNIIRDLGF